MANENDHKCQNPFYYIVGEDPAQVSVLSPGKYLVIPQENIVMSQLRIITHPSKSNIPDGGVEYVNCTMKCTSFMTDEDEEEARNVTLSESLSEVRGTGTPKDFTADVRKDFVTDGDRKYVEFERKEAEKEVDQTLQIPPTHLDRDQQALHDFYFTKFNAENYLRRVPDPKEMFHSRQPDDVNRTAAETAFLSMRYPYLESSYITQILDESSSLLDVCQSLDENYAPRQNVSDSISLVKLSPDESFLQEVCYVTHKDTIDSVRLCKEEM